MLYPNRIQRILFTPSMNFMMRCKKKRLEAHSNRARARWALLQGISEFIFYICA